ncbi:MAG TPA: IPTL-CTERM sorting domain-containing protein [Thermoanaerobaculia bacterium]|nr:IPTL-CTERM sorting domain-containing protein [Thermoanaerobaculia bacterium]
MRIRVFLSSLVFTLPLSAAVFTVTTADDSGPGSFRQAIIEANAVAGPHSIDFAIGTGPQTIAVLSPLPEVTMDGVNIDASTQPGHVAAPIIELNGAAAGLMVDGLRIVGSNVTVRGFVINRFGGVGLYVTGSGVDVMNNYIGLGLDGNTARGNGSWGLRCLTSCNSISLGSPIGNDGNVISANGGGMRFDDATDASLRSNYIGTDATGLIDRGNINAGIEWDTSAGEIGSFDPAGGNVISGNGGLGLSLSAVLATSVSNNRIGVGADGVTPLGNGEEGIEVSGGTETIIGGVAGAGNTIAYNGLDGVRVSSSANGIPIRGNAIFANGQLGISFNNTGTPVPNDLDDPDTGANNRQNDPVLTSATFFGGEVFVNGTLNSTPNSTFDIDVYSNLACDASGFGEGQTYLGTITVMTDGNGDVVINDSVPHSGGGVITATATNTSTEDTSQFSACRVMLNEAASSVQFSGAAYGVNENAGTVTITVTRTGSSEGPATVEYQTAPGTATVGADFTSTSGILVWANGDTASKTFDVTITDDAVIEAGEQFTVSLSDATGATLGAPILALVAIADEDALAAAAAVPTASEWALITLGCLLALAGALAIRR